MHKILFSFSLALLILFSCNSKPASSSKKSILDTSIGKTSEVLVVCTEGIWESMLGDTIRGVVGNTSPWLYVEEPQYDLTWVVPKYFEGLYMKYRNILIIEVNPHIAENKVTVTHNTTARPQSVVRVELKDKERDLQFYIDRHEQIFKVFEEREMDRIVGAYKGIQDQSVSNEIVASFGFDMVIPKGFYVATNDSNFMWLRKITRHIDEAIMIYKYPYTSESDLSKEAIIKKRNEITYQYIPGPIDSSYMKVSDVFPAYVEAVTFQGQYATLIRSWYDVAAFPYGGPFLSYTFVDPTGKYLICMDGFVHAPKKPRKRDILMHLEAIFSSFEYKN